MRKARRALRAALIAAGFIAVFVWSQRATYERSGESVPGIAWALLVVALIFLATAFAAEQTRGPEDDLRKDAFWGLGAGAVVAAVLKWFVLDF